MICVPFGLSDEGGKYATELMYFVLARKVNSSENVWADVPRVQDRAVVSRDPEITSSFVGDATART